jgi:hypothetical protein
MYRIRRPAREDSDEAAAEHLVSVQRDRTRLDELHRRPALELTVAEPLEREAAVRAPADRVDHRPDEATDRVGIGQTARSQSCRSIAASIPHGT